MTAPEHLLEDLGMYLVRTPASAEAYDRLASELAALRVELLEWRRAAVDMQERAMNAEAALQDAREALREEQDAFRALVQGVGAMLAGTRCYKRPKLKTEPDPGPCGRCAACLAVNAYAAAKDRLAALSVDAPAARAVLVEGARRPWTEGCEIQRDCEEAKKLEDAGASGGEGS